MGILMASFSEEKWAPTPCAGACVLVLLRPVFLMLLSFHIGASKHHFAGFIERMSAPAVSPPYAKNPTAIARKKPSGPASSQNTATSPPHALTARRAPFAATAGSTRPRPCVAK